jgi:hypothetical protein
MEKSTTFVMCSSLDVLSLLHVEVEPCVDVLSSYNQGLCFLFVVLTMSLNVLVF